VSVLTESHLEEHLRNVEVAITEYKKTHRCPDCKTYGVIATGHSQDCKFSGIDFDKLIEVRKN
jgi:hypothetical protein